MIWYDMIWYDIIWFNMIWYDMIWYDMMWYDMIWYDMIMIWDDIIWYNMIWCDVIWYNMIWYDIIWYNCRNQIKLNQFNSNIITSQHIKYYVMSQTLAFTYCALDIPISSSLKKQSDHRHITSHHITSHDRQEAKHTRAIRPSYCDDYNWMYMQYCPYNITHAFNYNIHIRTEKQPLYCTCCLYVPRSYVRTVCGETNLD